MIQELLDNATNEETSKVEDSNKKIGERIKRYSLVNNYFDNYLRVNKKRFFYDYVKYTFIYSFIAIVVLYMTFSNKSFGDIIRLVLNEYMQMFKYAGISILNSVNSEVNIVLKEFANFNDIQIPIFKNELRTSFTLEIIVSVITIFVLIYFLVILYQYLIQRDLFNSTLTQYYVPIWGIFFYFNRDKNHYIYVKLIKHMKQNNIISIYSNQILRNIFHLDKHKLKKNDKVEIDLIPKKFLGFYDYYILTYTINKEDISNLKKTNEDQKTKETIKKVKDNIDNELDLSYLDNVDIDNIWKNENNFTQE